MQYVDQFSGTRGIESKRLWIVWLSLASTTFDLLPQHASDGSGLGWVLQPPARVLSLVVSQLG